MLTPEQLTTLTKMYEDVQNLKAEVNGLREYKMESTSAIKALMEEKDKLAAEVKTLKAATAQSSAASLFSCPSANGFKLPGQPATTTGGYATPSTTGGFVTPSATGGFATPSATGGFATPSATGGFATPSMLSATGGFTFSPTMSSATCGLANAAAGKPTQNPLSPWNTRPTR